MLYKLKLQKLQKMWKIYGSPIVSHREKIPEFWLIAEKTEVVEFPKIIADSCEREDLFDVELVEIAKKLTFLTAERIL